MLIATSAPYPPDDRFGGRIGRLLRDDDRAYRLRQPGAARRLARRPMRLLVTADGIEVTTVATRGHRMFVRRWLVPTRHLFVGLN